MKITKIGHCCLLIETEGKKVLTDPGAFTSEQDAVTGIDLVLITHEHNDHLHIGSLKQVVKNNPKAKIITNSGVSKILIAENILHTQLESGVDSSVVSLEAFPSKHEEIFEEIGQVENTSFILDGKLLIPGDSYFVPPKAVAILALPVAGPWARVSEVARYALAVKPKLAFPIHDGMLRADRTGANYRVPGMVLEQNDIKFVPIFSGEVPGCENF
ncbi:MAG: MBL fold metallo-hydrolase [Candidatus Paceibacterota bacterium]|jgi:L-ascorbate metabolism protein UlaG (beta-lactamase superfamily)